MAEKNEHHGQCGSITSRECDPSPANAEADGTDHALSAQAGFVSQDPWADLKKFTQARIALGRVGSSLPTKEILDFGYSHAMARDAVHRALDETALCYALKASGFQTLSVQSAASNRQTYLLRPDMGRRLSAEAAMKLREQRSHAFDLLLVVGDGLSSLAISRHAQAVLEEIHRQAPAEWKLGPIVVATQARVAIGDEIGELLSARAVAILIGERPGLTSPDSLGIYLTYAPRVGCSDAERNCISNIRPEGLNYASAARKLVWLAKEAMRLSLTGVGLKDQSDHIELGEA